MKKIFLGLVLVGILGAAEISLPPNLLQNGDFEAGVSIIKRLPPNWGDKSYDQKVIKNPFDKTLGKSLKISRKKSGNSIGAQTIVLDPAQGNTLVVSGFWQGQNIAISKEHWNGAKVQIIFLDRNDKEIDQPNDIAHSTVDFGWQMFIKNVVIPQNAVKAKVLIGLWDTAGEVIFDELQIYAVQYNSALVLQNGDFETWGNWDLLGEGQIEIHDPGYGKGQALYVKNTKPIWAFGAQVIPVKPARTYRLSGVVKYTAVTAGKQEWQRGRVYAEYLDDKMEVISAFPEGLQYFNGTSGWKNFSAAFTVPAKAKFAKLYFGLQDATGEIAFDNLKIE